MANVDDVFNLLNAVNRETLKRMEDKGDRLRDVVMVVHERLDRIEDKLGIPRPTGPPAPPS